MNCPQCGQVVAEGSASCPNCGTQFGTEQPAAAPYAAAPDPATEQYAAPPQPDPAQAAYSAPPPQQPYGAPPQQPYGAAPGGGSNMPAFRFNPTNLTTFDWIGVVGTFVLFISLFVTWYSATVCFGGFCATGSADALYNGYMYITLILCIALVGYYVCKVGFGKLPFNLPFPEPIVVLAANALNLLLVIINMINSPSPLGLSFGAWLGIIAALAASTPSAMPYIQKYQGQRSAS
jgi:hypothetical protein